MKPEARNALMRLMLFEMIDGGELEAILDGLNQFDGEVGMDELDYLLSWAVMGTRDVEHQRSIYHVFEDKGDTTKH